MLALVEGHTLLGRQDRYRFLCCIGSGTFAVILRAWDTVAGAAVAIKCTQDPVFNAIGEREAALLTLLNARDPGGFLAVVRLLDQFTQHEHHCLVLELLAEPIVDVTHWGAWRYAQLPQLTATGAPVYRQARHKLYSVWLEQKQQQQQQQALDRRRPRSGKTAWTIPTATPSDGKDAAPLSLHTVRQIAVQLCAALAFLHDHGVIHADLKPENVLCLLGRQTGAKSGLSTSPGASANANGGGGTAAATLRMASPLAIAKLVDFGNCIERHQIPLYEADGQDAGFDVQTLAYRAPEVATGLVLTPAMDMWSLGCVLVECITGAPLFTPPSSPSLSVVERAPTTPPSTARRGSHEQGKEQGQLHTVELIDQMQWLVTGGRELSAVNAAYGHAPYYHKKHIHRQAASQVSSVEQNTRSNHALMEKRISYPSLYDRLAQHRVLSSSVDHSPLGAEASEWDELEDFIKKLLDIDPRTRLSARAAFVHPFLQRVFPFQCVFAPGLSPPTAPIDTSAQSGPPSSTLSRSSQSPTPSVSRRPMRKRDRVPIRRVRKQEDGGNGDLASRRKAVVRRRRQAALKQALQLIPTRLSVPKANEDQVENSDSDGDANDCRSDRGSDRCSDRDRDSGVESDSNSDDLW